MNITCFNGLEAEDLPVYSLFINVAVAKMKPNNSNLLLFEVFRKEQIS